MFSTKSRQDEGRFALDEEVVLETLRTINSPKVLGSALQSLLGRALAICGADEGSVMLLGDDSKLRISTSVGLPPEVIHNTVLDLGAGIAGKVAQTGTPLLLNGEIPHIDEGGLAPRRKAVYSALCVALKSGHTTVGVLNLNITTKDRTFSQRDLSVAAIFAEEAAIAIERSRLLQRSDGRAMALTELLAASKTLLETLEPEALLTNVLNQARALSGVAGGIAGIVDGSEYKMCVFSGLERDAVTAFIQESLGTSGSLTDGVSVRASDSHLGPQVASSDWITSWSLPTGNGTRLLLFLVGEGLDEENSGILATFLATASLALRNASLADGLSKRSKELVSIVYSMTNPVIVADARGTLVTANPAAEDLFGFSTVFQAGHHITNVLNDPALISLLTEDVDDTIETVAGMTERRVWKAKSSSIRSGHSQLSGRVLVLEDVTAEREFAEMKANFVAVVGHELRTPMTLIKGFLRTLVQKGDLMTETQRGESLQTLESQAVRLERLIEDLLFVSRIENSRPELAAEHGNLMDVIHNLLLEFQTREPGRHFSMQGPDRLNLVFDKTKVEQIVVHLVDNACKYSDPSTPVVVSVHEHLDHVSVAVTDRGTGILSGDLEDLFRLLHQVDGTSTRSVGGLGVGLYICKSLVESHGGRMEVHSLWGKGSTFTFTIPKGIQVVSRAITATLTDSQL